MKTGLDQSLHQVIESCWDQLIANASQISGHSYLQGCLHFERARCSLAKIEHSLQTTSEDSERPELMSNGVRRADFVAAHQSIESAIRIFEGELLAREYPEMTAEICEKLSVAKGKRAILLMVDGQYAPAARQFQLIIDDLARRTPRSAALLISECSFLQGNCALLADEPGCEQAALAQFAAAFAQCRHYLQDELGYDAGELLLPLAGQPADRLAYLSRPHDSPEVKRAKEVMSLILDKTEDLHQLASLKVALAQSRRRRKPHEA